MALYAAIAITGMTSGILLRKAAMYAIASRQRNSPSAALLYGGNAEAAWAAVNGMAWLIAYFLFGFSLRMLEVLYALSACMVLTSVDLYIRRIPNRALALLFLGALAFLYARNDWASLGSHLLGAMLGAAIFVVPVLIERQVGMGDVKLAAAIGFYLGALPALAMLLVMSILLLGYGTYALLAKKRSLKSIIALGPYMSIGFIITLALLK